jgi:hypothetical protein
LFLGNSLVRYQAAGSHPAYDIPATVQRMRALADEAGITARPIQTLRVIASDGMGLGSWWNGYHGYDDEDGTRYSAARAIVQDPENERRYDADLGWEPLPPGSGGWHHIVMLSLLSYNPPEMWDRGPDDGGELPNIDRWYRFIRASQPHAEIIHYMGAADSRIIFERQPIVNAKFEDIQREWGGRLAPVGPAFVDAMRAHPDLELRRPDQNDFVHFNTRGVLIAASVFYGVLYGDPTAVPLPEELQSVDHDGAAQLRRIAWVAVQRAGSAPR